MAETPVTQPCGDLPPEPAGDPHGVLQRATAFARSLLQQNTLEDLLWDIASKAGELFGLEDCVVYIAEPQGLVQYAAYGVKSPAVRQIRNRIVVPLGQGIVGNVAKTGVAERITDTRLDPRYIADEFQGRSELAVPISYAGRVIGVLDSESSRVGGFTAADQGTFELVATLAAPRIASALAERGMLRAEAALQRAAGEHRERERRQHGERLESLGQLAGGIAHDFNNLLTAILGNVAMVRDSLPEGQQREMLAEATSACDRARGLTKQLLTFASGGAPALGVGDLGALVREVVTAAVRGSGVEVAFDLPSDLARVAFDPNQLTQVFQHLAQNASQAIGGEGKLQVKARNLQLPDRQVVEVRLHDDGPGVPAPLRERVFDPYFSTKQGGAGLGLSTAFWIVRRHGGLLELDPRVERGACFVVRLPAVVEPPPAVAAHRHLSAPTRLRALVVDDDMAVRQVMVRVLGSLGHEVVPVGDSVACVREFAAAQGRGAPFHVVLIDLTLSGGMDGREALTSLRQIHPNIPAIVVSGYHESAVLADPRRHGFAARLEKPFTQKDLLAALHMATGWSPAPAGGR